MWWHIHIAKWSQFLAECPSSYLCSFPIWNEHESRAGKASVIISLPCVVTTTRKAISLVFSWAGRTQRPLFYTKHLHIALKITSLSVLQLHRNTKQMCSKCEKIIRMNLRVINTVLSLYVTHIYIKTWLCNILCVYELFVY